jgi:hypothetical protein
MLTDCNYNYLDSIVDNEQRLWCLVELINQKEQVYDLWKLNCYLEKWKSRVYGLWSNSGIVKDLLVNLP